MLLGPCPACFVGSQAVEGLLGLGAGSCCRPLASRYFRQLKIFIFILYYYRFLRLFGALVQPVFVGSQAVEGLLGLAQAVVAGSSQAARTLLFRGIKNIYIHTILLQVFEVFLGPCTAHFLGPQAVEGLLGLTQAVIAGSSQAARASLFRAIKNIYIHIRLS